VDFHNNNFQNSIQYNNALNKEPTWLGKLTSTVTLGYVSAGGVPKMGTPEYEKYINETAQANVGASKPRAELAMQALSAKNGTIEEALASFGSGAGKVQESIASGNSEYATELAKLTELAKKGIITDAELAQRKQGLVQKYYLQETEGLKAAKADQARAAAAQKLVKALNLMATSVDRTFSNMEAAISKASYQLASTAENLDAMSEGRSVLKARFSGQNIFENPNAYSKAERQSAVSRSSGLFGKDAQFVEKLTEVGSNIKNTIAQLSADATQNPNQSKEVVAENIQRAIDKQLRDAFGDNNLSRQLSEQLKKALEAQKNEDTKEIDFDKLLAETTGLTSLIEAEQKAFKALADATKLAADAIDLYNKQIEKAIAMQNEAIGMRTEAITTKAANDFRLTEVLGGKVSLQDRFKARAEEGASATNVKVGQYNLPGLQARLAQLEGSRTQIEANRNQFQQTASPTDPQSIQNIANFNRSLAELDNEIDRTKNGIKNLPKTIQGALDDVFNELQKKVGEFEAKQQAGGSFGEKLVTSTPTELLDLNNTYRLVTNTLNGQVRTIQQSVAAQQAYAKTIYDGGTAVEAMSAAQTAFSNENKAAFSMFSELISVAGIEKPQANQMRADFLENMAKSQGMNLQNNPLLNMIIANLRKEPGEDPEINRLKILYQELQNAQQKAAEQARKMVMDDSTALITKAGETVKQAIESARISFNTQQLQDMGLGISRPADVMNKSRGGVVYASSGRFIPKGTDTIPAMLSPGEYVVNAKATSQNLPLLNAINKNNDGVIQYLAAGTTNPVGKVRVIGGSADFIDSPYRNIPTEMVKDYENARGSYNPVARIWAKALRAYGPNHPLTRGAAKRFGIQLNDYGYPVMRDMAPSLSNSAASSYLDDYDVSARNLNRPDNVSVPRVGRRYGALPNTATFGERAFASAGDTLETLSDTAGSIGRGAANKIGAGYRFLSSGVGAIRDVASNAVDFINAPYAGLKPEELPGNILTRNFNRLIRTGGVGLYGSLRGILGAGKVAGSIGTSMIPTTLLNSAAKLFGYDGLSNEAAGLSSFGIDALTGGLRNTFGSNILRNYLPQVGPRVGGLLNTPIPGTNGISGAIRYGINAIGSTRPVQAAMSAGRTVAGGIQATSAGQLATTAANSRFAIGAAGALAPAVAVNTALSGIREGGSFLIDREGYSRRLAAEEEAEFVGSRNQAGQAVSAFVNPARAIGKFGRASYSASQAVEDAQVQSDMMTRVQANQRSEDRGIQVPTGRKDSSGKPIMRQAQLSANEYVWVRSMSRALDRRKNAKNKDEIDREDKIIADLNRQRNNVTRTIVNRGYLTWGTKKEKEYSSNDIDSAVDFEKQRLDEQRTAFEKAENERKKAEETRTNMETQRKANKVKQEQEQAQQTMTSISNGTIALWNNAVNAYNQGVQQKQEAETRALAGKDASRFLTRPASPALITDMNKLGAERAAKLAELAKTPLVDPMTPKQKRLQDEIHAINQRIVDSNHSVLAKTTYKEREAEWTAYNKAQDRAARKAAMEQVRQEKLQKNQEINRINKLQETLIKVSGIPIPRNAEKLPEWRKKVLRKIEDKFYLSGDTAKDIELMTSYGMTPELAKNILSPMTEDQKSAIYGIMADQTRGGLRKYNDNDLKLLKMSKEDIIKQRLESQQYVNGYGNPKYNDVSVKNEARRQELERAREKEFGKVTNQISRYDRLIPKYQYGNQNIKNAIRKNVYKQLTSLGYIDPRKSNEENVRTLQTLRMSDDAIAMVYPNNVRGMVAMARSNGGIIYASEGQLINFRPQGTDTVPAMLTPGEFVVNARATKQHLPLLQAINKAKGGKVSYFNAGGITTPNMSIDQTESSNIRAQQQSLALQQKTEENISAIGVGVKNTNKLTTDINSQQLPSLSNKADNYQESNTQGISNLNYLSNQNLTRTGNVGKYLDVNNFPGRFDYLEENDVLLENQIQNATNKILQAEQNIRNDISTSTMDIIASVVDPDLIAGGVALAGQGAAGRMANAQLSAIGRFNRGGMVYASKGMMIPYQPRGTDTVPAMLTPGEFVINAKAANNNLGLLHSINNGYSNGGVVYHQEGGAVKDPWNDIEAYSSKLRDENKTRSGSGFTTRTDTRSGRKVIIDDNGKTVYDSYDQYRGLDNYNGLSAFGINAAKGAGPTAAGIAAGTYVTGAALPLGPFAPLAGLAAGVVAGIGTSFAQEYALDKIAPETNARMRETSAQYPVESAIGSAVPGFGAGLLRAGAQSLSGSLGQRTVSGAMGAGLGYGVDKGMGALGLETDPESSRRNAIINFITGFIQPGVGQSNMGRMKPKIKPSTEIKSQTFFHNSRNLFTQPDPSRGKTGKYGPGFYGGLGGDNGYNKNYGHISYPFQIMGGIEDFVESSQKISESGRLDAVLRMYKQLGKKPPSDLADRTFNYAISDLYRKLDEPNQIIMALENLTQTSMFRGRNRYSSRIELKRSAKLRELLVKHGIPGMHNFSDSLDKSLHEIAVFDYNRISLDKPNINTPINKSMGGIIYANNGILIPYQPKGTDTVPAMLTPGEFVINRNATAKNLPLLQAINNGDASFMARGGQVNYMAGGGLLGQILTPMSNSFVLLNESIKQSIKALQDYQRQLASTQPNSVSTNSSSNGQLTGLDGLGQFVVKFDQFITAVNAINLPPVINLQVAPIQVNITGAEALTAALEGPMGAMLSKQISSAFGRLSAATEGAIPT